MPTQEEKSRAKKGIKARQDAIKALIANHQDEFDQMVIANRKALGLSLRPAGPSVEQLTARQERLRVQLEKVERDLAEAT